MKNKLIAFLLLIGCLSPAFAQTEVKSFSVELNAGMWVSLGLEAEFDYNLGSVLPEVNGLNLHGSLILVTESVTDLGSDTGKYVTNSGFGASGGLRYYFGSTGMDGFYAGAFFIYAKGTEKPSSSTYGTGEIELELTAVAGEAGYRFLLGDLVTLSLGASAGYMFPGSIHIGTITFNPATTGGLVSLTEDGELKVYIEFTVAIGIAF